MAPRIGITTCAQLPDYVESIRRAGGDPHVLDPAATTPARALGGVDGLLFTGGKDIDPSFYGEPPHAATELATRERDEFELELARLGHAGDVPRLGLCRGAQVLNVAQGGSLIQDIQSFLSTALAHEVKETPITLAHEAWISRGSLLWQILQERLTEDVCWVNSRHHQAVGRVAQDFVVVATAPDGVVEAIERPGARFCFGVQWHPENFWRTGEFRCLFEAFVEACRRE